MLIAVYKGHRLSQVHKCNALTQVITVPCSVSGRWRSARQGLPVEDFRVVRNNDETSVCFCKATRRHIPEGYHLHTRRRENMKSHTDELAH
jgi:hypothetical protein